MKESEREFQKKTLEEVADYAGVRKQTIYKYEHGIVENIPYSTLASISEFLHTTPAYLMGWTEEKIADNVGSKIRTRRIELKMTQGDLALKLGYHHSLSIDKIEKGIVQLSPFRIVEFASVLQCTPDYLMGFAGDFSDGLELSEKEKQLIINYRARPEIQKAVDVLLGL